MKKECVLINYSKEQIAEYIDHIRQKDPWKAKKVEQDFNKDIKVSD